VGLYKAEKDGTFSEKTLSKDANKPNSKKKQQLKSNPCE